jgi:hypothetical protein
VFFGMLYKALGSYIKATITNESYLTAMTRAFGVNVPHEDGFDNADKIDGFVDSHSKGYAERTEQDYNDCSICLMEFNEEDSVIELHCKHIYHKECFESLLSNNLSTKKCPLCRSEVKADCEHQDEKV